MRERFRPVTELLQIHSGCSLWPAKAARKVRRPIVARLMPPPEILSAAVLALNLEVMRSFQSVLLYRLFGISERTQCHWSPAS
jgi:hypothetical protein